MALGLATALAALGGLLVGSFLNVVAWRLPRGESLMQPGSHCPRCDRPIRPWENVPVLSWLFLRGRCAGCGESISIRYPLVEATTAALYGACVLVLGADRDVWLGLALVTALVPLTLIDLEHRILPNRIVGPGAVVALALVLAFDGGSLDAHLIAAVAAGGGLLLALLAYPGGMGMGDVKLAGMLGLYLGRAVAPAMLVALVAGTLVGGVVMARKGVREGRKTAIPFGPFLALGGLVGLFAGDEIVDWYLDTVG